MGYDFSADDIFEIAEQLERNGVIFYRTAAEGISDPDCKTLLMELAKMEESHEEVFSSMRTSLTAKEKEMTAFDPDGESSSYLKALADTRVFFDKEIDTSSMKEILKEAIIAEKDSIVFYLGMKEMIPENLGKNRVDDIIKDEMSHIKLLSNKLLAVGN